MAGKTISWYIASYMHVHTCPHTMSEESALLRTKMSLQMVDSRSANVSHAPETANRYAMCTCLKTKI